MTIADPSSKSMDDEPLFWIHRKSGGKYDLLYHGLMEGDLSPVVIYTSLDKDGPVWVRPAEEFFDGRFVPNRSHIIYSGADPVINTEYLNDAGKTD